MVAKKTATKKPAAKKPVAKKTSTAKTTKTVARKKVTAKKPAPMRSFRVYKSTEAFTTFKFTRQTLYWIILLGFIVITQLWILKIQMDIALLAAELLNT
jgi:hypothetical protein